MFALAIFSLLFTHSQAYSEFHTTCTTPPPRTNYVASPDTRGTLDILWSCPFTIIACTWTIQHLNVPEQIDRETRDLSWYKTLRRNVRGLMKTLKWMLVTIVAPEYILGKAGADFYAAYESKQQMKSYADLDDAEWSLTHAFFANMGGFVLPQKIGEAFGGAGESIEMQMASPHPVALAIEEDTRHEEGTILFSPRIASSKDLVHARYSSSNNAELNPRKQHPTYMPSPSTHVLVGSSTFESVALKTMGARSRYRAPFHLLAYEIKILRDSGTLSKLPKITTSDILDKSKGDTFVKIITSFQVSWFILQVVYRAVRGLSVSQLEITVTAFGVCAIITYILLLPKPKHVQIPIVLQQFEDHIPIENREFAVLRKRRLQGYVRAMFTPGADIVTEVEVMGSHIPNDAAVPGAEILFLHFGVSIGGVIFGAIHIAAWNLSFPTSIEQTLWRTASIMATTLLPVMYIPLFLEQFFFLGYIPMSVIQIWDIVFGCFYVLARAFLLVEIFRTLFYLPEDAYMTTWAASIPHIS